MSLESGSGYSLHGNVLSLMSSHIIKSKFVLLKSRVHEQQTSGAVNTFLVCTNPPDSHLPAALAVAGLSEILTSHGTVCAVR